MKPDLSKEGMKRFFLYHSEKIILAVAVGLMGLFFWLGFSAPKFAEKTPTDLVRMSDEANRYIANPEAWEQIRGVQARTGELDLVERIQVGNNAIDVAQYPFGFWSIRTKTFSKRKDPQLIPPTDLVASHLSVPVFWSPRNVRQDALVENPIAKFPLATENPAPRGSGAASGRGGQDDEAGGSGRGRSGQDGRGGGLSGILGAGIGAGAGDGESGAAARQDDVRRSELEAGTEVLAIHEKTMPGIRPRHFGISDQSEQVLLGDVVVVTGLIDIKQLRSSYLDSFMDSIGYFPARDRPEFKHLEVQRALMVDGQEPVWEDISDRIELTNKIAPRSLILMPGAEYPSAPESVNEANYDPVLTSPIPAFAQFDYRRFVNHPKLDNRKPEPLLVQKKAESMRDLTGALTETSTVSEEEKTPVRTGSDTSKYQEVLNQNDLKTNYKLVRFFDIGNKQPGQVYQYRMRAWLADPNNESPDNAQVAGGSRTGGGFGDAAAGSGGAGTAGIAGRGGSSTPGRGGAPRLGGIGGISGGEMAGTGGRGNAGAGVAGSPGVGSGRGGSTGRDGGAGQMGVGRGNPGGGSQTGSDDDAYTYVALTPQMKEPEVRNRLTAGEQKPDPKEKDKYTYFIQEPGYEGLIQIPAGKEFLRFCRPTPWSESVTVQIKDQPRGDVIAGKVETPRTIRVGTTEIPEAEPAIDVVVAPWDQGLWAMIPGRKKAFRGEALDFSATAHVLNPLSWLVHRIENAPVLSKAVMVDLMGGAELALPRDEVMRQHTASEMLVMQPDGSLRVTNDLADRTKYKQALLQPDDVNEFGTARRPEPEPSRPRSGPGGRPGR